MNDKLKIEAALERSLRKQVVVPRLDRKFDARVWARIEAEESRSASAVRVPVSPVPKSARWLYLVNIVGVGAVVVFLCTYGAQMLAGSNLEAYLPDMSRLASESFLLQASTVIAAVAAAFGLMFTPVGRRLREELG